MTAQYTGGQVRLVTLLQTPDKGQLCATSMCVCVCVCVCVACGVF